jgi:hypothetical protein
MLNNAPHPPPPVQKSSFVNYYVILGHHAPPPELPLAQMGLTRLFPLVALHSKHLAKFLLYQLL